MITDGTKVGIRLDAYLPNGTKLDIGSPRENIWFEVGSGQIVRGVDDIVREMDEGDVREILVPCNKAFGSYNPDLIEKIPIRCFPNADKLPIGEYIEAEIDGSVFRYRVVDICEEFITFDGNHELAGKDIVFRVELMAIAHEKINAVEKEKHAKECSCGCEKLKESLA